jgi:hypothetical protein
MKYGFTDDKQDSISEYTKDKMTNTVYVKKVSLNNYLGFDSISITSLTKDFSDSCDSGVRIAFNDTNIGKRVIVYANELDVQVLDKLCRFLYNNCPEAKAYDAVMEQIEYNNKNNIKINLPYNELMLILKTFKEVIL